MRQLSCQKSTLPPADVADRDYMHISANAVNFDAARMCRQISTHGATQTDSVFFHLILKLYVKLAPGGFRSQHLFACLLLAQMQSISTRRADVQTDLDTRGYLDRLCVSSSDSHIICQIGSRWISQLALLAQMQSISKCSGDVSTQYQLNFFIENSFIISITLNSNIILFFRTYDFLYSRLQSRYFT